MNVSDAGGAGPNPWSLVHLASVRLMPTRVIVVQHGDKERRAGDPGLTAVGVDQAMAAARAVAVRGHPTEVWSSPLRRAIETAAPLAERTGVSVQQDARLRERMNWDDSDAQSLDAFLDDWAACTADRERRPRQGDSSADAARRFIDALDDLAARRPDATTAVVAHGGVTTDALRTLLGDEELARRAPTLIDDGVPCGALTTLEHDGARWTVVAIAATDHLPTETGP